MPASRLLPTEEAVDLLRLVRDLATNELLPLAASAEAEERFPREVFRLLGRTGLLGLPYAEEHGGGGQPYEVYLQVLEEIASVWASVGVGVSVHALSCFGLVTAGTDEQRQRWLPDMLGGELLGAYCLSEAHAGSDPAAMRTTARRDGDAYVLNGAKAWTTHGGHADFYKVMARTSDEPQRDLLLPGPGRRRRAERRPARAQDGADRLGHGDDALRRRPGPGGAPARRGGRRAPDRAGRSRQRAARHRGGGHRTRAGCAGPRARLRPRAGDLRPADHRAPGAGVRAGRHGGRRPDGPGDDAARRPPQGPRAAVLAARRRWPSWSPPTTP